MIHSPAYLTKKVSYFSTILRQSLARRNGTNLFLMYSSSIILPLRFFLEYFSNLRPCELSTSRLLREDPSTLTSSRPRSSISFHLTRQQHQPSDRLTGIPGSMPRVYRLNPTSTLRSLMYATRLRRSGNRELQRRQTRPLISRHMFQILMVGVQISWLSSWREFRNSRALCQRTMSG